MRFYFTLSQLKGGHIYLYSTQEQFYITRMSMAKNITFLYSSRIFRVLKT